MDKTNQASFSNKHRKWLVLLKKNAKKARIYQNHYLGYE
jgi:hypothetical protein